MHSRLRLTAATIAVLAGVALAAPGVASAQVEVADETTGAPCNPCLIHAFGESRVVTATGITAVRCSDEYSGTLNADGTGEVAWVGNSDGPPGCILLNCTITPGESDWGLSDLVEEGPDEAHLNIDFCLQTVGSVEVECNANWQLSQTGADHGYEAQLSHHPCTPSHFISGQWTFETPGIEFLHL